MNEVVVVNEKDEVIGTISRDEAHRNGIPHRIAIVYVTRRSGEILVQIRKTGRIDHSSAGHVDPNETYEDTAYRELREELGISGVPLTYIGSGVSEEKLPDIGHHRVHVFSLFTCVAEPIALQPDEVQQVYWANPEQILDEMHARPDDLKYTGAFRSSLPLFLQNIGNK